MMKTFAVLLVLGVTVASGSNPANGCGNKCASCVNGICMACHQSDLIGGTCDLVRLSIPNCMLTSLDQDSGVSTCAACEKGFAFDPFA